MKQLVLLGVVFCCSVTLFGSRAQTEEKQESRFTEAQSSPQQRPDPQDNPAWEKDLSLRTDFTYERGTWTFHFTVTNRHASVAYSGLKYEIVWFGSENAEVKSVTDVIAPGKSISLSETKAGPSPFGKVSSSGGGMILSSKEKNEVVGIAIDEEQLDKSIRTKVRIVGAEPSPAAVAHPRIAPSVAPPSPAPPGETKSAGVSKLQSAASSVKIAKADEGPRLTTISRSSVAATNDNRFVFVALEFGRGSDPVAAVDFLLVGLAGQEFHCAGLGDGRGAGRYCLDPNLKFTRRVWQDEQYFDGGCAEHSGGQLAYDTFSTNKPVAVFIVPGTVPTRDLVLRYKGASLQLVSVK